MEARRHSESALCDLGGTTKHGAADDLSDLMLWCGCCRKGTLQPGGRELVGEKCQIVVDALNYEFRANPVSYVNVRWEWIEL